MFLLRPRRRARRVSRLVPGRLVFQLSRCSLDLRLGRRSRGRQMEKGLALGIFPGRLIRQVEVQEGLIIVRVTEGLVSAQLVVMESG